MLTVTVCLCYLSWDRSAKTSTFRGTEEVELRVVKITGIRHEPGEIELRYRSSQSIFSFATFLCFIACNCCFKISFFMFWFSCFIFNKFSSVSNTSLFSSSMVLRLFFTAVLAENPDISNGVSRLNKKHKICIRYPLCEQKHSYRQTVIIYHDDKVTLPPCQLIFGKNISLWLSVLSFCIPAWWKRIMENILDSSRKDGLEGGIGVSNFDTWPRRQDHRMKSFK